MDWPDAIPVPRSLRHVVASVRAAMTNIQNLARLAESWQQYAARAARAVPTVHCEDGGSVLHLGELSPGCRACKEGTWDCIFVTSRCNLHCPSCVSTPGERPGSAFGASPAEILARHRGLPIEGLAFSGGEPFLEPERLLRWIARFRSESRASYYWVYTNGLLATPSLLERLAATGVDEIRFNLSATGYAHPVVLEHVRVAASLLRVTVEIPVIPGDAAVLLGALPVWVAAGVRGLNLHELLYEPHSNAAVLEGPRCAFVSPDGHASAFDPRSREIALDVLRRVDAEGLPLSVNVCSVFSKLRQLRGRRRIMGSVLRGAHEELVFDELVTCCLFDEGDEIEFVRPDRLAEARRSHPRRRAARLTRLAPLAPGEEPHWIGIALLQTEPSQAC